LFALFDSKDSSDNEGGWFSWLLLTSIEGLSNQKRRNSVLLFHVNWLLRSAIAKNAHFDEKKRLTLLVVTIVPIRGTEEETGGRKQDSEGCGRYRTSRSGTQCALSAIAQQF